MDPIRRQAEAMEEHPAEHLERSEAIVGYRTKIRRKPAFQVTGYTLIVPPQADDQMIPRFWREVIADGSLDALTRASSAPTWVLGLGSWDPECEPGGQRYTICIEETDQTYLRRPPTTRPLHREQLEACDWMCFEMGERLWRDDPYTMLRKLGYRFHLRVGVHFDAYPPGYRGEANSPAELWISVAKYTEACDVCSVRDECAGIQPFE